MGLSLHHLAGIGAAFLTMATVLTTAILDTRASPTAQASSQCSGEMKSKPAPDIHAGA